MPTLIKIKGYRFFFYSNDHDPIHIHVEKNHKTAKILLGPIELIKSKGFNASELKLVRMLVNENVAFFKEKWHEYFNKK